MSILDTFKSELEEHMDNQPYYLQCSECGADLEIAEKRIDRDMDLSIKVIPCGCAKGE